MTPEIGDGGAHGRPISADCEDHHGVSRNGQPRGMTSWGRHHAGLTSVDAHQNFRQQVPRPTGGDSTAGASNVRPELFCMVDKGSTGAPDAQHQLQSPRRLT